MDSVLRLDVVGRPATFATVHEAAWREAVRQAVRESGVAPVDDARFAVRMIFRTPLARNPNERWDIDNLVKPTLDAMEGVFGWRAWRGLPQPADDRVDRIEAEKRDVREGELPGATIDVWILRA